MTEPVLSDPRFFNEEAAFAYVEAHLWPEGPTCPHCGATAEKIGRLEGVRSKPSRKHPEGVVQIGLRKCYACRQPFTVRKGTIFEDSHLPLRMWLQAIHLLCASKKGMSTRQLQRMLNCGLKTAWHLSHRIREIMKPANDGLASPMGGEGKTLEADFTFVGRKPGTKVRRGNAHMNPVLSLVERDGSARSFHMPTVRGETIHAVLDNHASPKSDFMTDEAANSPASAGTSRRTEPSNIPLMNTCDARATGAWSPPTPLKGFSRSSNAAFTGRTSTLAKPICSVI